MNFTDGMGQRGARGFRKWHRVVALGLALLAAGVSVLTVRAAESETHPFAGVTHITRVLVLPRPVKLHVVLLDLKTPGLRFRVTPPAGPLDTRKQTTLDFLKEQNAQLAINAHFFEPWPVPRPDPGTADLIGLAVSDGRVYSPFEDHPPKSQAIRPNAPALNLDAHNAASLVHRRPGDPEGRSVVEPVTLHNAVSGNVQLLTGGINTAGTGEWDRKPGPLTIIGLAPGRTLVILVVDGRQAGVSEGLSTREAADLLHQDYAVTDALNLDGGGSSTLCMRDPVPRVVNVPVGRNNLPGTLRPVGSNLAVFATPR